MIPSAFRSLRWQIQLYHATILALLILVFCGVLYGSIRWSWLTQVDQELAAATNLISEELQLRPDAIELSDLSIPDSLVPRRVKHLHELPYCVVWLSEWYSLQSDNPHTIDCTVPVFQIAKHGHRAPVVQFRERDEVREAFRVVEVGSGQQDVHPHGWRPFSWVDSSHQSTET